MSAKSAHNKIDKLCFSNPINPSTHQPFYFLFEKDWMSRHGHPLHPGKGGIMVCPESGLRYKEVSPGVLKCMDLDEEDLLPEKLAKGSNDYRSFKAKPNND